MQTEHDVVIIGGGAGGLTAALGLVRRGLSVHVLECGPRFSPGKDWPAGRPEADFEDPFQPHVPDSIECTSQRLTPGNEDLRSTLPVLPRTDERRFSYARACGLGGSTLRYQGEAHRLPPAALASWPLGYEDLAPYYAKVESLLGVSGEPHPAFPRQAIFPNPAHTFSPATQRIAQACRLAGMTLSPNSLAIPSRPFRGRLPCIRCKGCTTGCLTGAKSSADNAILPLAQGSGNFKVSTGLTALRVEIDRNGLARAVLVADAKGGLRLIHARAIVLSAGALETPRLLLNSSCPGFQAGLANRSGFVGLGLMENIHAGVWFLLPERCDSHLGLPIEAKVWDHLEDAERGFTISTFGAPDEIRSPATFALWAAPGWGREHRDYVRRHFGAQCMIFATAEHRPHPENRILLSAEKDRFGQPKALVQSRLATGDLDIMRRMLRLCLELAERSGTVGEIGRFTAYDFSSASHPCGTVRMGRNSNDSVANAFGQCHDIQNLFIADASLMPTQGPGTSPSLTIQALALRTADYLAGLATRISWRPE